MESNPTELPPFIKTWPQLYWLVMGALLAEIVLFYLLMRWLA